MDATEAFVPIYLVVEIICPGPLAAHIQATEIVAPSHAFLPDAPIPRDNLQAGY